MDGSDRQGRRARGLADGPLPVVVVGGGVSGCACAAELALSGVPVTLVSASLDALGLPAESPDMLAGAAPDLTWDEVAAAVASLPSSLASIWLRESWLSSGDVPAVIVDRREVSLETKWLLENLQDLRLRQAVVEEIRLLGADRAGGIEVRTAFGEVFRGRACVLAVGLGLGGRVYVGEQVQQGGRYGEVTPDELGESLRGQGVSLARVSRRVGERRRGPARSNGDPALVSWAEWIEQEGPEAVREVLRRIVADDDSADLPEGYRRGGNPEMERPGWPAGSGRGRGSGCRVLPDGRATGEVYMEPEGSDAAAGSAQGGPRPGGPGPATRRSYTVKGYMVTGAGSDGRVPGAEGLWVSGQAAGAVSCLERLESGVSAARSVVGHGGDRPEGATAPAGSPGEEKDMRS